MQQAEKEIQNNNIFISVDKYRKANITWKMNKMIEEGGLTENRELLFDPTDSGAKCVFAH